MQALWKTVWRYLKKLKMDLPYDPVILLLGTYLKKPGILIQKNISMPMFTVALFTVGKIWTQPRCLSVSEWIKQPWYIYTMEYYHKKENNFTFVRAWMNLGNFMPSEKASQRKTNTI